MKVGKRWVLGSGGYLNCALMFLTVGCLAGHVQGGSGCTSAIDSAPLCTESSLLILDYRMIAFGLILFVMLLKSYLLVWD